MATIYHNPNCSKSIRTLAILQSKGIQPDIVLYLQTAPNATELSDLLAKLNISAAQLVRKSEQAFKANHLDRPHITERQLIATMVKYPELIERPIVVIGDRAVLGRPPENVLAIIE